MQAGVIGEQKEKRAMQMQAKSMGWTVFHVLLRAYRVPADTERLW